MREYWFLTYFKRVVLLFILMILITWGVDALSSHSTDWSYVWKKTLFISLIISLIPSGKEKNQKKSEKLKEQ